MSNDNNNNKNPLDTLSTTASELNEVITREDNHVHSFAELAERYSPTDVGYPVKFRQTRGYDAGSGILKFEYRWESSTGYVEHLNGCQVGERVDYPGGDPYNPPTPPFGYWGWANPTIAYVRGTNCWMEDTHSYGIFTKPFVSMGFSAMQQYIARHEWWPAEAYSVIQDGITINRKVYQKSNGQWMYEVSKSGVSASGPLTSAPASRLNTINNIHEILKIVESIQVGSTRADILKEFMPCGGLSEINCERYQLVSCPSVRIDVRFEVKNPDSPFDLQDKIVSFSKYYLDTSRIMD